ncbi:biotin--[acetyl-CoA-carboxylase] ligase [candidate division WOR-3 bacterium]|nr:biotin--[acetyl-CoA-carboxylase] ligase [candidate division WOR-3 bacterium]
MKAVSLTIDGKRITAPEGEKLLWAALDNGIYIPHLCAIREAGEPQAACRLCFVEVAGRDEPVTACTEPVVQGMVVNTKGARSLRLARTSFELIMTSHPADCASCPSNGACELQRIASHLGVGLKSRRLRGLLREFPVDNSSPLFNYDPNKCVLCGRCVWECRERLGIGVLGFAYRGFKRVVTTFGGEPIASSGCRGCGECVAVCPAGALTFKENTLSPANITRDLGTQVIGRRVVYHPTISSTMKAARDEANRGAAEGTVIITDEQTAGRGRVERVWLTPKGGIALSVVLYPDIAHLPCLIMLASLAVARTIEKTTDLKTQLKWPNDVLIRGKKVSGILVESSVKGNSVGYASIGIGINANLKLADFPDIRDVAISLSDELGRKVSRLGFARHLLREMDGLYAALRSGGSIFEAWRDRLGTLGKEVSVTSGGTVLEGVAEKVARDGSLWLIQANGHRVKVVAGDVKLRERA